MTLPKPSVDRGYSTPAHGRIPGFQNIEEEAAFWDTTALLTLLMSSLRSR